jgi:hypothetical protein
MSFYYFPSSGGGGGGDSDPIGVVYRFNSQTYIPNTWTFMSPGTLIEESSNTLVSDPTTNWKFTVPTGGAGHYAVGFTACTEVVANALTVGDFLFAAQVFYGAAGASETRLAYERVAGSSLAYAYVSRGLATMNLADGDTVQFKFIATATNLVRLGSSNSYDSRFFVVRLGGAL